MSVNRFVSIELCNMCMIYDDKTNKVLVQDKIPTKLTGWGGLTFPGGHVENGESIIDSTIREIKEETGLLINDLKACGIVNWYNTSTHNRFFVFLYKTNKYSGILIDESEEGKVFWMDINEFINSKLAPLMDSYMEMFLRDNLSEAFGTWNDITSNKLVLK